MRHFAPTRKQLLASLGRLDQDGDRFGQLDAHGVAKADLGEIAVLRDLDLLGRAVEELENHRVLVSVDGDDRAGDLDCHQ